MEHCLLNSAMDVYETTTAGAYNDTGAQLHKYCCKLELK